MKYTTKLGLNKPDRTDYVLNDVLNENMDKNGLTVRTSEMVKEVVGENGTVKKVVTDKGEYEADTVIMAVGVRPNTKWLQGIVELNPDGTVVIDDYLETSEKDIFAMGDDWQGKFDFLKDYCEVIYLPRTQNISTTELKKELNKYLGISDE